MFGKTYPIFRNESSAAWAEFSEGIAGVLRLSNTDNRFKENHSQAGATSAPNYSCAESDFNVDVLWSG
jgi:hypothetical protein